MLETPDMSNIRKWKTETDSMRTHTETENRFLILNNALLTQMKIPQFVIRLSWLRQRLQKCLIKMIECQIMTWLFVNEAQIILWYRLFRLPQQRLRITLAVMPANIDVWRVKSINEQSFLTLYMKNEISFWAFFLLLNQFEKVLTNRFNSEHAINVIFFHIHNNWISVKVTKNRLKWYNGTIIGLKLWK